MNTRIEKQVAAVANLSLNTVFGVEGISFEAKALSIPGVTQASDNGYGGDFDTVLMLDGETEIDIEEAVSCSPEGYKHMIATEKYVIIGGLSHDGDVGDPCEESDGEGQVFCRGRRGSRGDDAAIETALGLNQYGDKDLGLEAVCDEMAAFAIDQIKDNRSLMTTLSNLIKGKTSSYKFKGSDGSWARVREMITSAVHQEGGSYAKDYIADWFLDVPYWCDVTDEWKDKLDPLTMWLNESDAENAFDRAFAKGKIGNPLAIMLDVYEHGGITFSVSGSGMQSSWGTSRGGAIWVPDADAEENIRSNVAHKLAISNQVVTDEEMANLLYTEAQLYAKSCVEAYSEWRNGETYRINLAVIDRETGEEICHHQDSESGFYGSDSAEGDIELMMLARAVELTQTKH